MYRLSNAPRNTLPRVELADSVGLSASGVTRLLLPMEKIKLIEKEVNPRDARMSLVKLSAAGKQLFEDASVTFEYAARTILQPLSENQVTRLCEYTTKLL